MKKLILTLVLALAAFTVSANSVRYFTIHQATRVANTLDAQPELMIYCGYEYELATYVIVNEVWTEPVNSKYYEIWLFGFDAYTGEEIYMPIDLACIWLYSPSGNRMYSAAQYLRFRSNVAMPNFYWTMPPYNAYVRHFHDPMFNHCHTYHYDIHRYGWRPPAPPTSGPWIYHPYYMRPPHVPAPVPSKPFTPGVDYPQTTNGHNYIPNANRGNSNAGTRSSALGTRGSERSGSARNNAGNPGTTNRVNNSSTNNSGRSNGAAISGRGTNTDNSRGTTTNTSRGTATNTSRGTTTNTSRGTTTNTSRGNTTDNSRGNATTDNSSRNTNNNSGRISSSDNSRATTNTSRATTTNNKSSDNSSNRISSSDNDRGTTNTSRTTTTNSTNRTSTTNSTRGTNTTSGRATNTSNRNQSSGRR